MLLDHEIHAAGVDVGRQHLDAHAARIGDVVGDFLAVVALHLQHGCHVFQRVMRLEIGRLDGDHRIIGGMGTIEAVTRKPHQRVPNGIGLLTRQPYPRLRSFGKNLAMLDQHLLRFLADATAYVVRFARRVAGDVG